MHEMQNDSTTNGGLKMDNIDFDQYVSALSREVQTLYKRVNNINEMPEHIYKGDDFFPIVSLLGTIRHQLHNDFAED